MHGMAGRLREREAVSHAATETTNTFTAAAKGFGLDRQAAHDYRNAHPELGGGRRDHPEIAADALEGEARSRGLHIYFARVSRTRAVPCTECTDSYERARILQGFRAAVARAVYGEPGESAAPRMPKQGAPPHKYFGRVSRTRALPCTECTDPCERARIPQGFRAAVARSVYGEPGESAAPRMPKQGAPPLVFTSGACRARARCRVRIVRILHDLCAVAARAVYENRGGSTALRGRGALPGSGSG